MKLRPITATHPRPRDYLTAWTTAPLSTADLGLIPSYQDPPPPGHTVTIHGQDIFVRRTGKGGHRQCSWYVHGLEGMSQNWDRLTAALAGNSTGWAVDLPGSGRSAPAGRRHSVVGDADLIASMIRQECGHPVHLVGNSRGGIVATVLAARHPDLVRTMTLISPAVPDLRPVADRGADIRLGLVMVPGIGRSAEKILARLTPVDRARSLAAMCFGEPEALVDGDLRAAEAEYAHRAQLPWVPHDAVASLQSLIRSQLSVGPNSFARAARRVRVPVLVVWGTRDRLVDARLARRTAAAFADSHLLMLPRTGHVAQMERPEATARAMLALWSSHEEGATPRPGRSRG